MCVVYVRVCIRKGWPAKISSKNGLMGRKNCGNKIIIFRCNIVSPSTPACVMNKELLSLILQLDLSHLHIVLKCFLFNAHFDTE